MESSDVDDLKIEIIEQGAVRVNAGWTRKRYADIALIEIDLHSKYARYEGICDGPSLILGADADTMHRHPNFDMLTDTIIRLPEYEGWAVYAVEGPRRYTMKVVLMKDQP